MLNSPRIGGVPMPLLRRGTNPLAFLLDDQFLTDVSAGSVDGTAAEPGRGTRTVTDTSSLLSINSGVMSWSSSNGDENPKLQYGTITRAPGLAMMIDIQSQVSRQYIGFRSGGASREFMIDSSNSGMAIANQLLGGLPDFGSSGRATLVLRSSGGFLLQETTLLWVANEGSNASLTPALDNYQASTGQQHHGYVRIAQLPAPWDDDYGIATDRESGTVSIGSTYDCNADFILEFTQDTLPGIGAETRVAFRYLDDNNHWYFFTDELGRFHLYKMELGTATPVATLYSPVTAGMRIVLIASGSVISGYYDNTLGWTYSSATFQQAQTGAKLLGDGGTISNLVTWPRTITGNALTQLNRMVP